MFTLVYESRDATKDVDAVVRPAEIGMKLAMRVATELDLPEDWLNDDVRQFLAEKEAKRTLPDGDFGEGLRIVVPTAAYLLAMKLRACRPPLPGYAGDHEIFAFWSIKWGLPRSRRPQPFTTHFFLMIPWAQQQGRW